MLNIKIFENLPTRAVNYHTVIKSMFALSNNIICSMEWPIMMKIIKKTYTLSKTSKRQYIEIEYIYLNNILLIHLLRSLIASEKKKLV